jgi:hypothetical protein
MSRRATQMAWEITGISPSLKLTLIEIADHYNEEAGFAWAGQPRIAAHVGVTERALRDILARLVAAELLIIENRPGKTARYKLPWYTPEVIADTPEETVRQNGRTPEVFVKKGAGPRKKLPDTPEETSYELRILTKEEKKKDSSGFDLFWAAYPKKAEKADTLKEWIKLKPNTLLQAKILEAVAVQARTIWRDTDVQYIPSARKWLHGRRWEDEIAELRQPADPWRKYVTARP